LAQHRLAASVDIGPTQDTTRGAGATRSRLRTRARRPPRDIASRVSARGGSTSTCLRAHQRQRRASGRPGRGWTYRLNPSPGWVI